MAEELKKKTITKKTKPEEKPKVKPKTKTKTPVKKTTTPEKVKKVATQEKTSKQKKPVKKEVKKEKEVKKPEEKIKRDEKSKIEKEEKKTKKPKIKPQISEELKKELEKRKQIKKRTPEFLREEWFRYKRISRNWRRPDGISSKMRKNLKYRPNKVRVGFRGPKTVRGLHSSGFEEVTIFNINDLKGLNPKTQAARIGRSVGTRKRIDIEKKAEELNIRLLNL
jgi:large subunit ribosomal protein L32e